MLYNRSSRTRKNLRFLEPNNRRTWSRMKMVLRPAEFERGGADSRTHEDRTRLGRNRGLADTQSSGGPSSGGDTRCKHSRFYRVFVAKAGNLSARLCLLMLTDCFTSFSLFLTPSLVFFLFFWASGVRGSFFLYYIFICYSKLVKLVQKKFTNSVKKKKI